MRVFSYALSKQERLRRLRHRRLLAARPPKSSLKHLSRATTSAVTPARANPKRTSIVPCIHVAKRTDVTAMSGYTIGRWTAASTRQNDKTISTAHLPECELASLSILRIVSHDRASQTVVMLRTLPFIPEVCTEAFMQLMKGRLSTGTPVRTTCVQSNRRMCNEMLPMPGLTNCHPYLFIMACMAADHPRFQAQSAGMSLVKARCQGLSWQQHKWK